MWWSVDNQNSAYDYRNIKMDYLHFGLDLRIIDWQWIYLRLYYYVDWYNSRFIILLLFKNKYLVWRR